MDALILIMIVSISVMVAFVSLKSSILHLSSYFKLFKHVKTYARKRFDAYRYLFHGVDMISDAYKQANGKSFEIPGPDHNHIFVSSKSHLAELKKAGRNELSMFGATKQMFQPAYTMLGHNWLDERGAEGLGYVRAVGILFPSQLLKIMPEMEKVVDKAFSAFIRSQTEQNITQTDSALKTKGQNGDKSTGDVKVPAYKMNKTILCKLNAFCFFGEELAQNDLFIETIFKYNELVIEAAEVLRVLPEILKGFIGPIVGQRTKVQEIVFKMINDHVTQRIEKKKLLEAGKIVWEAPNDMMQWIIDTAPLDLQWGPKRITYEIIAIWFGSVHALSATVTYVLFNLCKHPEYVDPLRNEVESPDFDVFMKSTKGLPLLDSFIKESSRFSPIEAMSGRRQALRDFSFSDGTLVKKGDWACVPAKAILTDESFFPRATEFEGFRFAPLDKIPENMETVTQPEGHSKYSDISANYHSWGVGGIICPGRFYSAISTKLILANALKNFDLTLIYPNPKMSWSWRSYILPKEDTLINFSPRRKTSGL